MKKKNFQRQEKNRVVKYNDNISVTEALPPSSPPTEEQQNNAIVTPAPIDNSSVPAASQPEDDWHIVPRIALVALGLIIFFSKRQ